MGDIGAEEPGIINQLLPLLQQLYPTPAPATAVPAAPAPGAPVPVRPGAPVYSPPPVARPRIVPRAVGGYHPAGA
jgi:hypothetical protein